jgi:carbamate kinase
MLVVTALGGNALFRRGEPVTAENQRRNVRIAAQALAPVAKHHQLVVGHGSGPQAGMLSLQGSAGADTERLVGYMIEQELGNLLPFERAFATLLTMIEVDPDDAAFHNPNKFIGPPCTKDEADRLSADKGWVFKQDDNAWRRVVASPEPKRIFELRPIKWLLERNTIVVAAGGGGVLAMSDRREKRALAGAECVIDKDLASELLARELCADLFVMLTDSDAVYMDWGMSTQKPIRRAAPNTLAAMKFAAGSMAPKVAAACRFAAATGKRAAIGTLADLDRILSGEAGTTVSSREIGVVYGT